MVNKLQIIIVLTYVALRFNRGVDFRKAFKEIGTLRALIDAPFVALTASAPKSVQSDVISSLHLVDPVIVSGDLNRKNIFISTSIIRSLDVGAIVKSLVHAVR